MTSPTGPDDSTEVLTSLRGHRAVRDRAEIAILNDVLDWCVIYQTDDEGEAAFGDHGIPLAGDGAPWVSEFAVMELGAALGVSTDSAKRYIGAALEVRYRLPKIWERVASGGLPFWKARFIAERTMCLPAAGALFVDRRVAFVAHKIGYAETQRQIDAAQLRYDPDAAEKARRQAADGRCFDIFKGQVSPAGTVPVSGTLDLPGALDLDQALSARAAELKDLGSEESLDVRRAKAIGDLARSQATLDYDKTRPVVLHVHGDTIFGNPNSTATETNNVGRCDNTRKDALVDLHCVFPWCTRPAARCDCDHAVPYGEGGPTCSCNTAPLCRGHHRLKTHGGWSYDVLDRGTYLWHTPHGHLFRRDHTGTEPVNAQRRRRP